MSPDPIQTTSPAAQASLRDYRLGEVLLIALAAACVAYAFYIAVKYANQLPLDQFSFRQTQTALTAYWMGQDGFRLAYETPVVGPPWVIPFEFPIYQGLVALLARITPLSLNASGRMLSFVFLAGCLVPVRSIVRELKLSPSVFIVFTALLFSSPLYLYWGRTFMIETTALFFAVVAIKYFVDLVVADRGWPSGALFVLMISLSILQKATTGLPVLATLAVLYLVSLVRQSPSTRTFFTGPRTLAAVAYFGIPLLIGFAWTHYTDEVKQGSVMGVRLSSAALSAWSWGTAAQRIASVLYVDVIWNRMFLQNLGGTLGLAALAVALYVSERRAKAILLASGLLGMLPLFLFSNLHTVHSYYQTGNLIFLIFALAVAIGHVLPSCLDRKLPTLVLTAIIAGSNYVYFHLDYLSTVQTVFTPENSRELAVSEALKERIPPGKYFVAFGNDWSSSLAYLSERKSFTVPGFFPGYQEISRDPSRFGDPSTLGGVVVCPAPGTPSLDSLAHWASDRRAWKLAMVRDCFLALPEAAHMDARAATVPTQCEGNIDYARPTTAGAASLDVAGWTAVNGKSGALADRVYVTLSQAGSPLEYFETMDVDRPDVNAFFGRKTAERFGFSRLIDLGARNGEQVIGVARLSHGRLESCQFAKTLVLPGKVPNG